MAFAKKVRRYRGWIAVAVLVVVGGVAYYIWSSPEQAEITTTYETEAASVSTISSTISGTGNVATYDTTEVYPDAGGTVLSIEVAEGDRVRAGTVLFTLDDTSAADNTAKAWSGVVQAQQGVSSASQGIIQAEASLLKAENNLTDLEERSEDPSSTVSDSQIEEAEKEVESAEAGLTSAHDKKDSADASLYSANLSYNTATSAEGDYVVTAPVDGVVWSLGIEEGDAVSTGGSGTSTTQGTADSSSTDAPVVIAPDDPLAVLMAINEIDIPALDVDQRAELEFDAISGLVMTGKVLEIASEGSNEQGVVTYDVWISLDVTDDRIMQSMSAAATIITEVAKDELTVPNAAVQTDDSDQKYVEVLDESGNPQTVYVTTGITSSTHTVILEGLSEGEEVITQTSTSGDEEEESSGSGLMMPGMGGGGGRP